MSARAKPHINTKGGADMLELQMYCNIHIWKRQ